MKRCRKYLCLMMVLFSASIFSDNLPEVDSWPNKDLLVQQNKVGDISCHILHLYYVTQPMLNAFLKQRTMHWLSAQGNIQMLSKQHKIIICDDNKHYQRLSGMLLQLNVPPKQIKIRAKIIRIDKNYLHDLGFNFSTVNDHDKALDQPKNGMRIILATLHAQDLLSMQIHALVNEGHADIIANPTILTHANVAANIESGEEVPYQEGALNGGTSIAFKKAVMQLSVTPHMVAPNKVSLDIKVHQDKVTPATVNGVPIISTEQLSTSATINNHNALLLGGIIEKQTSVQVEGVPILRHLPIVGLLFQHHRKQIESKELLIMIKPEW